MRFYMTPGSCSTGIHILLEECGLVFEAHLVDLLKGDQDSPAYRALNPKGTIPTLVRDDGLALTDFQSIAWWLARAHPRRKLLPNDLDGQLRALELMSHAVNGIHGQGFTRLFTSERYTPAPADQERVKRQGREIVAEGVAIMHNQLADRDYLLGDFSIADAALFYCEFWADRIQLPLPRHCADHYRRMLQRPAVRQVMMEEGYASLYR